MNSPQQSGGRGGRTAVMVCCILLGAALASVLAVLGVRLVRAHQTNTAQAETTVADGGAATEPIARSQSPRRMIRR